MNALTSFEITRFLQKILALAVEVFIITKEAIMETLTYDHLRADLIPMIGLSFILFGMSIFLLYLGLFTDFTLSIMGQATSVVGVLAGGFGTTFFGYTFFYILYRAVFPEDALTINDKGIINKTNALGSKKVIPFENMEKAKLEIIHSTPHVGINLYNEEEYLENLSYFKRILQEINRKNFGTSIISMNVPHKSREELHQVIDIINDRIEITRVRKEMKW